MSGNNRIEKNVLTMSVYGAIAFSVAGIVLGLAAGSQIILFDGLYSLISVGLSFLSLTAAAFMSKNDWRRFPFGKDMIQPLVILVKYFVILLIVAASLVAAFFALFQGGRDVAVGVALFYAAGATLACFIVYKYLSRAGKKTDSGLIKAESNQWLMDTVVSFGVMGGFVLAAAFNMYGPLQPLVPYVDPVMMILVSAYFIKVPLKEMRHAFREVLEMSPEGELSGKIESHVSALKNKYRMKESFVRVAKVGKTLWIEVDFVAGEQSKVQTIEEQDRVRAEIARSVDHLTYTKWLTVSFTNDRKWAI